jgi:hypothetical protein
MLSKSCCSIFLIKSTDGILHKRKKGADPMEIIRHELAMEWGTPDRRYMIGWPLALIVGKKE